MVERKLFLWNQSTNIMYLNKENVFMVPNNEKKKMIITCIHGCHNWRNNIDSKKMVERKAFLTKPSTNVIYPNKENMFMVPNR